MSLSAEKEKESRSRASVHAAPVVDEDGREQAQSCGEKNRERKTKQRRGEKARGLALFGTAHIGLVTHEYGVSTD